MERMAYRKERIVYDSLKDVIGGYDRAKYLGSGFALKGDVKVDW